MIDVPRVVLLLYPYAGYDRGILEGIIRYARIHGPWFFYLAGEEPGLPMPEIEAVSGVPLKTVQVGEGMRRMHLPDLRRWGATGIIGRLSGGEMVKMALGSGLPVIALDIPDEELAVGQPISNLSEIQPDSHQAGRLAAEHLLERGFKHFGFCGYCGRIWSERRRQGFCQRLEEAGVECRTYQTSTRKTPLLWQRERSRVIAWLQSLPKPAGVMACNDVRGRQVIEAATLGKILIPNELAVVGVDNDELLCELSYPALSSVAMNSEKGGFQAAELLDGLMSRKIRKPRHIRVESLWVVPRQSSDIVAVDDREVAVALRFIREKARQPIGVADVIEQVALSRRALEIRFDRVLGRSIRDEIQRSRLAWVKQLLLETDMPVAKISELAGFNSLSYLSKVFHYEAGETLAQYRRRRRPS